MADRNNRDNRHERNEEHEENEENVMDKTRRDFEEEKKRVDKQINSDLDIIYNELTGLHNIAKDINVHLRVDEEHLNETGTKMDQTTENVISANAQLKRIVGTSGNNCLPICCAVILILVFVSILGIILANI